jgi:DNA-binding FadR family transcriptional regulator
MTAYDRLAAMIRDQILAGELRPGDRLPTDADIASHYHVGRNTAREAQRVLASQGLLTIKRGVGGGAFVVLPGPTQLGESLQVGLASLVAGDQVTTSGLADVREVLEVPIAGMAALRRTSGDLVAMRTTLQDERPDDDTELRSGIRGFHTTLVQAARNPLLEVFAIPVLQLAMDHLPCFGGSERLLRRIYEQHREILSYIESQDQRGAREAARAHLAYLRTSAEPTRSDSQPSSLTG